MDTRRAPSRTGRKRRALGWTFLTLGLFAAAVWLWSGWWSTGWNSNGWSVRMSRGALVVVDDVPPTPPEPSGWEMHRLQPPMRSSWLSFRATDQAIVVFFGIPKDLFFFAYCHPGPLLRIWVVVLWPTPLLLWSTAALLLRSGTLARRRAMSSNCKSCGYDRIGLDTDIKCPECGRAEIKASHG